MKSSKPTSKFLYFIKGIDKRYKILIFLFLLFNLPILLMILFSGVTTFKIFLKIFLDAMILFVCFDSIKKIYIKSKVLEGGLEKDKTSKR